MLPNNPRYIIRYIINNMKIKNYVAYLIYYAIRFMGVVRTPSWSISQILCKQSIQYCETSHRQYRNNQWIILWMLRKQSKQNYIALYVYYENSSKYNGTYHKSYGSNQATPWTFQLIPYIMNSHTINCIVNVVINIIP